MLKNYFKIAWRNLSNNKVFTFINITGLAVGIAASILILIWIHFEMSVDRFHEHSNRVYAVWRNATMQGQIHSWDYTPAPYAPTMKAQFPEVEEVARITEWDQMLLTFGEQNFYEEVTFTDPGFFKIFSFEALEGDPVAALAEPGNIVLTASVAKKLFGDVSAIGQRLMVAKQLDFEVKAVIRDLPENTDFPFTAFLPFKKLEAMGWTDDYWRNNSYRTFVLLNDQVNLIEFNQKFADFTAKNSDIEDVSDFLFPIRDLHLYSKFENGKSAGGKIELIRLFGIISIIVLVLAAINFVNLSTAQSHKRSKEVGIRKISGAGKGILVGQFLAESTLIAFSAYFLALVIVSFSFESFQTFVGLELKSPFSQPYFWAISLIYVFVIGILAGSYPAFLLSSFKPTVIFKSNLGTQRSLGLKPREILVVFQFAVVVTLISSLWVVRDQMQYVQNRDLGIDKGNLIFHPVTESMRKNRIALRNELLSLPEVTEVSYTFSPLTSVYSDTDGMNWQGKDPDYRPNIRRMGTDANLVKTAGMELITGRDIDIYTFPNDSLSAILNEKTVETMGFEDPIGQVIKDDDNAFTVVGVVKDFIMESPFDDVVPIVVMGPKRNLNFIHIRFVDGGDLKNCLASVEHVFNKFNPDSPFEYKFVDQEHARKFISQERTAKLTSMFTGLAVIISCMGLFGLATFVAENRKKEISVRKVLGASIVSVVGLISSEFTKLVFISILIGVPATWYFMSDWLDTFAYRTSIDWTLFLWTGGLTLLIALFTVSGKAIKAALVNPAETLKSE
jgi:putative ABC transport system permease protein